MKRYISLGAILILTGILAVGVLSNTKEAAHGGFDLGLDLAGGTQLTYQADISELETQDVSGSINSLKTVLERRLNALGSSDIRVTTETASVFSVNSENYYRVNIEIPGVFDAEQAKQLIGKIPTLDFRLETQTFSTTSSSTIPQQSYEPTELSGRYIEDAILSNNPNSGQPTVLLQFDNEGTRLFAEITKEHTGKALGIFLDEELISAPVIQTPILNGNAEISGRFTTQEAQELAQNLQFGALPVPIELISTQSISPTLGEDIIMQGVTAGVLVIVLISLVLIYLYRLAGMVAAVALTTYSLLLLFYFKLTGTDMTAPGIAGLIITLGMAVDANILIFERIREEVRSGRNTLYDSVKIGFSRAWPSIRDGNSSSIIVAIILYYLTTSFVKGFALAFGVGTLISMFTAVVITRTVLLNLSDTTNKFITKYFI